MRHTDDSIMCPIIQQTFRFYKPFFQKSANFVEASKESCAFGNFLDDFTRRTVVGVLDSIFFSLPLAIGGGMMYNEDTIKQNGEPLMYNEWSLDVLYRGLQHGQVR